MAEHTNNTLEENTPYEAAFSYDELFPSLPEMELKPEVPVKDVDQWTQNIKMETSVITQASTSIPIPKEHHRFILGKSGKNLLELELSTATKITVLRPDDNSDLITITGTKEGIDKAKHEIQLVSDEKAKMAFEVLNIPKVYHPFIFGPFNKVVNDIINETGARVNIPPVSVMKNNLTIAGEKEAVAKAKERVLQIYRHKEQYCQVVSVEVPKRQHKYINGDHGQTIQEILYQTGVFVELPPNDVQSDTITLRGEQEQLGPALTLVYTKIEKIFPG